MKLYVSPGACSMSCHIAFEEAGLKFEPRISQWDDVERLNPQGAVPVLVLDDGRVLTQNIAILTYAADLAPESGLLPKVGTIERAQAYQWLSWVASDLQPAFGPLFRGGLSEERRNEQLARLDALLGTADAHMAGRSFLVGNQFTAADAYFFVVYEWAGFLKVPTDKFKNLNAFAARIAERPAVQAVLKREDA